MSPEFIWFLTTIAAKTGIVMIFLVIALRLFGKRQIGQMNIYDLAMILAISNGVQNAMTRGNGNLSVGIVSSATLLSLGWLLTRVILRHPEVEPHLVGAPTLLVSSGEIMEDRMRREGVTHEELMTALRSHGLTDPDQVMMAILEVDGAISVVPKTAPHHRTKTRVQRSGQS